MYIKLHHKKQWVADVYYLKKVTYVSSDCIISLKPWSLAIQKAWWSVMDIFMFCDPNFTLAVTLFPMTFLCNLFFQHYCMEVKVMWLQN